MNQAKELTLVSHLGISGSPSAGTRIPGKSAYLRNRGRAPGGSGDRRTEATIGGRLNKPFFLTTIQFHHPSFLISQNTALKPGSGTESRKTVQVAESCLGFHSNQDLICPD